MKSEIWNMKYLTIAHLKHSIRYPLEFILHFSLLACLSGAKRSTFVENVRQIDPFYAKQTQFFAFFAQKRRFHEKTNPIQTQYKANLTQNKANLSQFKANLSQFKAKTNPILKE